MKNSQEIRHEVGSADYGGGESLDRDNHVQAQGGIKRTIREEEEEDKKKEALSSRKGV